MFNLTRVTILSATIAGVASTVSADETGFSFGLNFQTSGSQNYNFSLLTAPLLDNSFLSQQDILPNSLNFSLSTDGGVGASLRWKSKGRRFGAFDITHGAAITGTYYNKSYLDADFTGELDATTSRVIGRLTDEAGEVFAPFVESSGISSDRFRRIFNDIATYIVSNPDEIVGVGNDELLALIPDDIPSNVRDKIIEEGLSVLNDPEVIDGLTELNNFTADFSGSAKSISITVDYFVRATLSKLVFSLMLKLMLGIAY